MIITKYNGIKVKPGTTLNDLPLENGDIITSNGFVNSGDQGEGVWGVLSPAELENNGFTIVSHDDKNLVRRYEYSD